MRQTFLHLRDKISLFTFLFLLAALSGGCCSRNRLMEGFHRDNYIVFEPISVSYMKYVLDLQDLNGIIAGVEKRSPDLSSNSALKDYLARLKTLNDNYNKTTPPRVCGSGRLENVLHTGGEQKQQALFLYKTRTWQDGKRHPCKDNIDPDDRTSDS